MAPNLRYKDYKSITGRLTDSWSVVVVSRLTNVRPCDSLWWSDPLTGYDDVYVAHKTILIKFQILFDILRRFQIDFGKG